MKKFTLAVSIAVGFLAVACAQPKKVHHSVFKLTSCGKAPTREGVTKELVKRGYLHMSETKGPYDIFHRPEIAKKGAMAQEPYEDKAGDIAVAVCSGGPENYILTEEWRGCKDRKDCTIVNQKDLRTVAENLGCQVSERSGHSKSWRLEDRQDWTKDTCQFITSNLSF